MHRYSCTALAFPQSLLSFSYWLDVCSKNKMQLGEGYLFFSQALVMLLFSGLVTMALPRTSAHCFFSCAVGHVWVLPLFFIGISWPLFLASLTIVLVSQTVRNQLECRVGSDVSRRVCAVGLWWRSALGHSCADRRTNGQIYSQNLWLCSTEFAWVALRWHQPGGKQLVAKRCVCVFLYNAKICLKTDGETVLPECFQAQWVQG